MNITTALRRPLINVPRYMAQGDTWGMRWQCGPLMTHTEVLNVIWHEVYGTQVCNWVCVWDLGPRGNRQPRPVLFWSAPTYTPSSRPIPTKPRREPKEPSC